MRLFLYLVSLLVCLDILLLSLLSLHDLLLLSIRPPPVLSHRRILLRVSLLRLLLLDRMLAPHCCSSRCSLVVPPPRSVILFSS